MTSDPYYASWDPGGSSTRRTIGLTLWDEKANPLEIVSLTEAEFDERIDRFPDTVKVFIIEKYIPFGHIPHTGNPMTTSQRIGDLKGYARRHGIKIVEQRSDILTIAAMWAQVKMPKNAKGGKKHLPDNISAYLHGYYHLFNLGLIKPKVLEEYD